MPLDRHAIERRDFAIARRGYATAEVDAHLAAVADELEALRERAAAAERAAAGPAAAPLAQAAADRVRAIVEAAERSAEDIERGAREEADRIRREAAEEAARVRADVLDRSRADAGTVGQATTVMLERLEAMEQELAVLLDAVRGGGGRLTADLDRLHAGLAELYDGGGRDAAQAAAAATGPDVEAAEDVSAVEAPAPVAEAGGAAEPRHEGEAAAPVRSEDAEGARIVALNMALDGRSREETERYLRETFALDDPAALLDDVWETIGA